jgi:hypothetical protein
LDGPGSRATAGHGTTTVQDVAAACRGMGWDGRYLKRDKKYREKRGLRGEEEILRIYVCRKGKWSALLHTYFIYINEMVSCWFIMYVVINSFSPLQLLDSTVYENVQGNCDNDDAFFFLSSLRFPAIYLYSILHPLPLIFKYIKVLSTRGMIINH